MAAEIPLVSLRPYRWYEPCEGTPGPNVEVVPVPENLLYCGDNLDVLRRHVKDASVDLVYLDPPFNSNANYNVLFGHADGSRAAAEIKAFDDTWRWDQAAAASFQETG